MKYTLEFVKTTKTCPLWDESEKNWCFSLGVGDCKKAKDDFKDCPTYKGFMTGFHCGYEHYFREVRGKKT